MRLLSTITRGKGADKHMENANRGCYAEEEGQMRFLSTRTNTNEIDKQKNKGNKFA
jgi:hypothetical protein